MNGNSYGLFSNFKSTYWSTGNSTNVGPFAGIKPTPYGYTYEILFPNRFWTNILDHYAVAPPSPLQFIPVTEQNYFWINEQECVSNDSLWSPIDSIVFTSTLLPIKAEQTGPPVLLGNGNLGFSAPTSASAFQPIITDIALDTSVAGAQAYRTFIYYTPIAEYRLSDFMSSKQEIKNIDIQVFWKCRLDNQLYPLKMFNLSSVSIKLLFRRRRS
jgi:hypothetical protein